MNNDLDIIVKTYPREQNVLRVYAIGDVHVGSAEFDERAIKAKIQRIADDPCGALVLCGDLGDFGLKNSKTNVYQATMQPKEQVEYIYELFKPVAHKLSACIPGNHEERIQRDVGLCVMYDLCVRWGVPEVYRENLAITKYVFGHRNTKQQHVFVGITIHGTTRNKHKKFLGCIDGADFAVSGHTHTPEYSPHGKIRIDRISGNVTHAPFKEIVVDANLVPGGYGIKKEYEIPPPPELQYLELSVWRGGRHDAPRVRIMDYHTVTI